MEKFDSAIYQGPSYSVFRKALLDYLSYRLQIPLLETMMFLD